MDIPLVQYQCDKCGNLTEVMDCDQPLPKGWTLGEGRHTHYCPKCSKRKKQTSYDDKKR
jgi:predicted nucleic acid-binding Zn ribbon protein